MTETLTLTTSHANADKIGQFAALLIGRRITFSGMTFVVPARLSINVEIVSDRVRVRLEKGVDVERPGFDVVLKYIDFFPDGRIFASANGPFGIEITREVTL
jgi:hypothetical protein